MTITDEGLNTLAVRSRSEMFVLLDQLHGIEAWTSAHSAPLIDPDVAVPRESRRDIARRRDVVERQRQAIIEWTAHQLRESDHPLRSVAVTRAVLVHRDAWFRGKVLSGLQAGGVTVVADLENGADALGVVIAEQPDLLLVEDKLPMVSGLELTRAVCRYAPSTVVVVHVANDWEIGPFLDAGATTVYTRRTPPGDIAAALLAAVPG